jgi:hypothetical protein
MKRTSLLATLLLALACPLTIVAQDMASTSSNETGVQFAGIREFTLGGGGASNKEMDSSQGALEFSYGQFLSPRSELLLRQSISYANPDNGDSGWNAISRLAYDYHFSSDGFARPFVGVNAGRLYGNNVNDSWTAGLELGSKFFVKPQTFIFANASYDWLFDRGNQLDDQFKNGRIAWSLGMGYQF